jgi:hypothetical protein
MPPARLPSRASEGSRRASHRGADRNGRNTDELFQATETLTEQDQELFDAFERVEEERIGPGTHERLHGMIDGLGARIEPWLAVAR